MTMNQQELNKALRGRCVVEVKTRRFNGGDEGHHARWSTDPIIIFDDGTELVFMPQETDNEHGVALIVRPPRATTSAPSQARQGDG